MFDPNFFKVTGIGAGSVILGFIDMHSADTALSLLLKLAQLGVAIATIVYISYKARNAKNEPSKK